MHLQCAGKAVLKRMGHESSLTYLNKIDEMFVYGDKVHTTVWYLDNVVYYVALTLSCGLLEAAQSNTITLKWQPK